jgi:hypothetical protein
MGIGLEHCVEDDQELAHAGGDHDFERFAGIFEALGESANDRVAAFGGEGRHIECATDRSATAPNGTLALEASAVMIEGSQSDERTDLFAVELSELRQIGEEGRGGRGPNTRSAAEDLGLAAPVVVGIKKGQDVLLHPLNVFIEAVDHVLNILADGTRGAGFEAIRLGGPHVDKLSTAGDELLEFDLFFRCFCDGTGPDMLAEAGDDRGIEAVGLGEDSEAARKITNLTRVDDGHEMTDIDELDDQASLIPTGGLDDDEAGSRGRELTAQLVQAAPVIDKRERVSLRQQTHIEGMLTDIDTDERGKRTVHGMLPVLQMRARRGWRPAAALAAVRAVSTKPATIMLCGGLGGPERYRSVAGRRGAGCYATRCLRVSSLRSLPHG